MAGTGCKFIVHFYRALSLTVGYTRGNESDFMHSMGDPLSRRPIGAGSARSHFLEVFCRGEVLHRQKEDRCEAFSNYPYHGARF
jgi:hypothetical protein